MVSLGASRCLAAACDARLLLLSWLPTKAVGCSEPRTLCSQRAPSGCAIAALAATPDDRFVAIVERMHCESLFKVQPPLTDDLGAPDTGTGARPALVTVDVGRARKSMCKLVCAYEPGAEPDALPLLVLVEHCAVTAPETRS